MCFLVVVVVFFLNEIDQIILPSKGISLHFETNECVFGDGEGGVVQPCLERNLKQILSSRSLLQGALTFTTGEKMEKRDENEEEEREKEKEREREREKKKRERERERERESVYVCSMNYHSLEDFNSRGKNGVKRGGGKSR